MAASTGAGNYEQTTAAVAQAVNGFDDASGRARAAMSKLDTIMNEGMARMAGDHIVAMAQLHELINQDQTKINQALIGLAQDVHTSNVQYAGTMEQQRSNTNRLAGMLGGSLSSGTITT